MREVVMDTNFLFLPYQFKIDVFRELDYLIEEPFQLVISSSVVRELRGLSNKIGKSGAAARFALKLLDSKKGQLQTVDSDMAVDNWVLDYSKERNAIACTNDAALKRKLKKAGIKVIGLRTRTRLGFI